jgi:hypothetical protein
MTRELPMTTQLQRSVVAAGVLAAALRSLPPGSGRTPCRSDPDGWFDGDAETRAAAAHLCLRCALRGPCGDLAELLDERAGVWGGVDRTRPIQRAKRAHEPIRTASDGQGRP